MPALKLIYKLLVVLLFFTAVNGSAEPLLLRNLRDGAAVPLVSKSHLASIAMVFQPACRWCKLQAKQLAKLQKHCGNLVNIRIVGRFAGTQVLRRELRYYDDSLMAVEGNTAFARRVGGVKAAPSIYFFNQQGDVVGKKRGFLKPEQLEKAVSLVTDNHCAAISN